MFPFKALAIVPLLAVLAAPALGADRPWGCYVASLPDAAGPISQVRLWIPQERQVLSAGTFPSSTSPDFVGPTVDVTLHGLRDPAFQDEGMSCTDRDDGSVLCAIECDGGDASWQPTGDGALLLSLNRLAMMTRADSLVLSPDAVAQLSTATGTFIMQHADAGQCHPPVEAFASLLTDLRAGDINPGVQQIEAALLNLGFFAGTPDWIYDDDTAKAVSAFQTAVGLPATGKLDDQTKQKLGLYGALKGSC